MRRINFAWLTLCGIALIFSEPVRAIVDVHEQYFAAPESSKLSSWSFDLSGATGNDDRQAISIETHNLLRGYKSTWLFVADYARAESNNLETEDNQFAHLRYVHKMGGGQGLEVFAQIIIERQHTDVLAQALTIWWITHDHAFICRRS